MAPDASPTTTVIRVKSKGPLPYLFPDQTLSEALAVMADWPLLPVAKPREPGESLKGILTLEDTLMAFRKAPKRKSKIPQAPGHPEHCYAAPQGFFELGQIKAFCAGRRMGAANLGVADSARRLAVDRNGEAATLRFVHRHLGRDG